jgi:two-component system cell cycle sensor histidine kinase/response regulator CckA
MNYNLDDLLDIDKLRELLDSLYEISIIPSAIIDTEGNVLIASAWQDICTKFHRINPDSKKQCIQSDHRIGVDPDQKELGSFYVCPMGLVDAATPIIVEGKHLGKVFVGQFFLEPPDQKVFLEQARRFGYAEDAYLEAMRKVPVLSEGEFRAKLACIGKLTQMLVEQGLQLKRQGEADHALRKSEERFRSMFEQSLDATFITAPDGTIFNANPAACSMFGMTEQELCAVGRAGIIDESDPRFAPALEQRKRTGRINTELTGIRKNGERFPAEVNSVITLGQQQSFVNIRDLSVQKRIEKALHNSEQQFRTLCEAAPIGIFRSDCAGNTKYVNPRWEEITGISASQDLGKGWLKGIHPDDIEELGKIWQEAVANERNFCLEHRQLTPQGKTVWVRALASPIRGTDGTISHVGTLEDITELRQARQEMLKTVKLESLGVLAGGIAHNFNNILTAVFGNISLARFQMHDSEELNKRLDDAEKAIVRAADLTKQLLTFARGGEPVKKIIKLNALLPEAVSFVLQGSNVDCQFDIEEDLGPVEVDAGQFAQVIHNLVLNAVQAMPQGGTLTVSARNITHSDNANRSVSITLADTGTGIPENTLQRIFDPYFTTKPQGNGLGLATCYSIIKKHGGEIKVESTVGEGTRFIISLQASTQDCEPVPESPTTLYHGSGRVLVMDDNEDIRSTAQAILEELGYTVESVEDGAKALELYQMRKEQGKPFLAVILDLTIPAGMGGKETIEKLLKIDPAVKAVVSSGYSNDPIMASYDDFGFQAVLTKPYRIQEMSKVLRDLIGL